MHPTCPRRLAGALAPLLLSAAMAPTALAADLGAPRPPAYNAEPSYQQQYLWTGLYGGISGGYVWGEATQFYDRAGDHGTATLDPEGFAGALTLGYNVQWPSGIVVGLEGDLGLMDVTSGEHEVFDGHLWSSDFGTLWGTLRGRAGMAFGNNLVYGTGGLAFMDVSEVSIGNTPGETATADDLRTGWVLGAGIEHAWSPTASVKLEYLHMDFGTTDGRSANDEAFSFSETADLVRAGVNFKF